MNLQRGARGRLDQVLDPSRPLDISTRIAGPSVYDCACFGLDQQGRLSDDRYMVFYNQPASPEGAISFHPQPDGAAFTVDLPRVPAGIERLSFTVSIDGAGTMGQVRTLDVDIQQGGDGLQLQLAGSDFKEQTAIIAIDLYRKDGIWRYGAVASGFNGGLGDLLRNFGGEEAAPAQPAAQAQPTPPPPAPPKEEMADTSAGKVSLKKGQKVSLKKPGGRPLTSVMVGLGWDEAARGRQSIDCDASAILCQEGRFRNSKDLVYFGHLKHGSKAVRHMGDNLTGAGAGDDEHIFVDLAALPTEYDRVVFVVNIYQATKRRQDFGMIRNAYIRLLDNDTGQEMCRYDLTDSYPDCTAVVVGEVAKTGSGWLFHAIGEGTRDDDVHQLASRFK